MIPVCRLMAFAACMALVACILFSPPGAAHAATEAGMVLNVTPGSFIMRGGTEKTAAVKDSVQKADVLRTDKSGRLRVLLSDDGSLDLGPDSVFNLEEYDFGGSAPPAFAGKLGQGFMRVITGKVVEQNPDGFKVSTPEGGVGIRGTIFSLGTSNGITTLFVENTRRGGVTIQGTFVPSGHKAVLYPDGRIVVSPMTNSDRDMLRQLFSARGGSGNGGVRSLAGAGNGIGTGIGPGANGGSDLLRTAASDMSRGVTPAIPGSTPSSIIDDPIPAPTSASYAGSFGFSSGPPIGTTGFDVHLTSGAASNGFIKGSLGYGIDFNLSGGKGGVSNGALNISNFSGTMYNVPAEGSISSSGFVPGAASAPVSVQVVGGSYEISGSGTVNKK